MRLSNNSLDLGELKPPLLIFGGAYSNLEAVNAVKFWAEQHAFTAQQCLFTGDMIGYCANPHEVADLMRDWGINLIKGNVEDALAEKAESCGCGFTPGSSCDTLSASWFNFAQSAISEAHRYWFQSLPAQLTFRLSNLKVHMLHGASSEISKFIFASDNAATFENEFNETGADLIIAGHCGLPFTRQFNLEEAKAPPKTWHNSGVIGMPANDGTRHCWFSILDIKDDEMIIHPVKLKYDAAAARNAMLHKGLNTPYAESLMSGLWPSLDILPDTEKSVTGQPILSNNTLVKLTNKKSGSTQPESQL